jgi:hypothetical protein
MALACRLLIKEEYKTLVSVVRFRPGPPRILRTRDLAHRISSVGRGLVPFPLDIPILNRPLKGQFMNGGFVIPASVNVVLNDIESYSLKSKD